MNEAFTLQFIPLTFHCAVDLAIEPLPWVPDIGETDVALKTALTDSVQGRYKEVVPPGQLSDATPHSRGQGSRRNRTNEP